MEQKIQKEKSEEGSNLFLDSHKTEISINEKSDNSQQKLENTQPIFDFSISSENNEITNVKDEKNESKPVFGKRRGKIRRKPRDSIPITENQVQDFSNVSFLSRRDNKIEEISFTIDEKGNDADEEDNEEEEAVEGCVEKEKEKKIEENKIDGIILPKIEENIEEKERETPLLLPECKDEEAIEEINEENEETYEENEETSIITSSNEELPNLVEEDDDDSDEIQCSSAVPSLGETSEDSVSSSSGVPPMNSDSESDFSEIPALQTESDEFDDDLSDVVKSSSASSDSDSISEDDEDDMDPPPLHTDSDEDEEDEEYEQISISERRSNTEDGGFFGGLSRGFLINRTITNEESNQRRTRNPFSQTQEDSRDFVLPYISTNAVIQDTEIANYFKKKKKEYNQFFEKKKINRSTQSSPNPIALLMFLNLIILNLVYEGENLFMDFDT